MYSCILFSALVSLAISFCGQIEGLPTGPIKLTNEEPEKQPLLQAESTAVTSAMPKMLHEVEREQKPEIETANSNAQESKEKGIRRAKHSLVHIPKVERTEIQEERTNDEKVKEKELLPKPKKEQSEIQEEIAIDEKVKGKGLPPKPKKEQSEIREEIAIDEKVKEKGSPPKPEKEQTEIQEEGNTEDEKAEIKRMISRSSTFSKRQSQEYTDDQLKDWGDAFAIYDIDKNGAISAEELQKTLRRLDLFDGSIEDVKKMIEKWDRDNSGTIDFQEFIAMMSNRSGEELEILRKLFDRLDKNGDGLISAGELKSCDLIDDDARVDLVIAEVDTNGDGLLDFIEFQAMLTYIGYYHDARKKDEK